MEFEFDPPGTAVSVRMSGASWDEVAELFLGPVFTSLLIHRRTTCLHAALLKVDDRVVALLGDKGAGKSTTALGLVQRGAAVVSDDIAAVYEERARSGAGVGPPRIRLKRDAAALLDEDFDELVPVWGERGPEKRYVPTPAVDADILPIDALYFLAPRGAPSVALRPVSPVGAVPRLMANRHLPQLNSPERDRRDFGVLARLAATVPVWEIARPDGLDALPEILDALLR